MLRVSLQERLSVSFSFLTFVSDEALIWQFLKWSLRLVACNYGEGQEQGPLQERSVVNKRSLEEPLALITTGM